MSAAAANRLHLTHKGRLNVGADADITIFDPGKLQDKATFEQPALPPEGIEYVLIGGEIALEKGEIRNANCGKSVRM